MVISTGSAMTFWNPFTLMYSKNCWIYRWLLPDSPPRIPTTCRGLFAMRLMTEGKVGIKLCERHWQNNSAIAVWIYVCASLCTCASPQRCHQIKFSDYILANPPARSRNSLLCGGLPPPTFVCYILAARINYRNLRCNARKNLHVFSKPVHVFS